MAKVTAGCRICLSFLPSAIATLLFSRLQGLHSRLDYGRRVYNKGFLLAENIECEKELNINTLDKIALAIKYSIGCWDA
ncbi:hypothetical protein LC607_21805 [Nostoc sp. CHAB 5824]|nr:hypothetical protein [Nostoc sp. CHAB 5824]